MVGESSTLTELGCCSGSTAQARPIYYRQMGILGTHSAGLVDCLPRIMTSLDNMSYCDGQESRKLNRLS